MKKKQKDIILSAKELFILNGYKDTSIADIAKKGNLSQVTLYKYYSSKYLLAQEVWVYMINEGYDNYFDLLKTSKDSFSDFLSTIINYKATLINAIHENFYAFFLSELANIDSVVRNAYDSKKEELYKTICYHSKANNLIDSSYSDESIFMYLDMFVEYFRNSNNKLSTANLIKSEHTNLLNLMLYGLFGKKNN